ncbi:type II CRISPR RNA-guided endonuclease Cas9 [Winogradskyella sp. PC D3.3]
MKTVLGLDLGTNSIGWALVNIDHENSLVKIIGLGSRIIPMDAGEIKDFESSGKIKSTAAQRTEKRGSRRLNERYLLRRDRLHLVLNLLDTLPKHYKLDIDFTNSKGEKSGQFKKNKEPKIAYLPITKGKKTEFLFMDSYIDMLNDVGDENVTNKKGKRIPYDWTLYYLRQKALSHKISLEELAWVLLSYNQKRGYEKTEVEDKSNKEGEIIEELDLRVKDVFFKVDKEERPYYEVHLEGNDNFIYSEYSNQQMTFKGDLKEVIKTSKVDEEGNVDNKKTEFKIIDIYELKIQDVKYEKENNKHKYILKYENGWVEEKPPINNFTYKYQNAQNKPYDYIVETVYDYKGKNKVIRGKERQLREPDFSDNSSDWTLLKKKTEKEALTFNIAEGLKNKDNSAKKFISPKIYSVLKSDAKTGKHTKIIGGMFQVVDRDFYREELNEIIVTQKKFHASLEDKKVFEQCVKTLYPKNKKHQEALLKNKNAIQHLLVEDILLYQRPLKSKKSEIANCKYEIRYWKTIENKEGKPIEEIDKETGEIKIRKEPIFHKVISTSHPYFQEFRIWDKLHNLKLIEVEKINEVTGEISTNVDVTKTYIKNEEDYEKLFEKLNNQKSLSQEQFLRFCKDKFKLPYNKKLGNFVWKFPEDEEIKGNETRVSFATRFKRCGFIEYSNFLTQSKELELWHYLYSVNYKERIANNHKSLKTFFNTFFKGYDIDEIVKEKIINDFANYPKYDSKYCAYSEKALKKLLPLIRLCEPIVKDKWKTEQWFIKWKKSLLKREEAILQKLEQLNFLSKEIDYSKVVDTNVDVQKGELPFPKGLFNVFKAFKNKENFKGLNLTQASYLVYGRHSELAKAKYWISPDDIRKELHQELKQHSLNNPIAEKVLLEMMQVVADIWDYYGKGKENFFSKIHLEIGRELKKSAKDKETDSRRIAGNRAQNKRIRQVLEEFLINNPYNAILNSKDHFERLKIVEDAAINRNNFDKKFFEENEELKRENITKKTIEGILKKPHITKADFEKYKLWIEQGYRSPYSGQIIKITDLFDGNKYNIDHIFPQALITNNSLSNKVVVEVELNKLKSNQTARAFIQSRNGQSYAGIPICSEEEYVNIVKTQFSGTKRFVLLSQDIPKEFTNSQMNNARHIARKAMELLSHIVREKGEVEFRSKNVLPVTGKITTELKRAWKLDQVWTALVASRYIRLNKLIQPELFSDNPSEDQSYLFGRWQTSKSGHQYFNCNLDKSIREKDESYNIKRIDHRHHALDALIVALCTEDHVNYINNINSNSSSENYGKQKQIEKYRLTLKRKIMFTKKDVGQDEKNWYYMLPGEFRKKGEENSHRDSVIEMSYSYKNFDSFGQDYQKMVLTALQHTVVTFKQNLRVINKTINRYNNTPNKNKFAIQKYNLGKKQNWAIRRQLSKETVYGKRIVNNQEIRVEREKLNDKFNRAKIRKITDKGIQQILNNHLSQFDTIKLPFEEAINYLYAVVEKQELEAIVSDETNSFKAIEDLIKYLRINSFKYEKTDYSKLNLFIEKISERNFRNEKLENNKNKYEIDEHPEMAFIPEAIEKMNEPNELKRLNDGEFHKPIYKVQTFQGFGKERAISDDVSSVKSKQFVVTAAGSNLYLGFYERVYQDDNGNNVTERKFKSIGLIDLIETLKQDSNNRLHPLPDKFFDKYKNEFHRIFTLSPLDLVYVPTEEEIENPSKVDFKNLTNEQLNRIYKYVDGSEEIANFVSYSVSTPIWRFHGKKNKEIYNELKAENKISISEKELIQNEFGLGSQQNKNQNMIDGKTQVKKYCWKLKVNRLGHISKA